jgi:hypothetical protein
MKTKVLIDPATLLEFLINRGHFEGNVKGLSELVDKCRTNEIDLYISSYGIDSIKSYINHWKNPEASDPKIPFTQQFTACSDLLYQK